MSVGSARERARVSFRGCALAVVSKYSQLHARRGTQRWCRVGVKIAVTGASLSLSRLQLAPAPPAPQIRRCSAALFLLLCTSVWWWEEPLHTSALRCGALRHSPLPSPPTQKQTQPPSLSTSAKSCAPSPMYVLHGANLFLIS